jgi:hypothetical protein
MPTGTAAFDSVQSHQALYCHIVQRCRTFTWPHFVDAIGVATTPGTPYFVQEHVIASEFLNAVIESIASSEVLTHGAGPRALCSFCARTR